MRRLLIATGWLVTVVIAILVGVVGINLVGSGLTEQQATPMTEDQVRRELRAISSTPATAPPSAAASSPPAPAGGRSFSTEGGLVVADCARIISMAPAQGWSIGEQDADEGEFRSVGDPAVVLDVDLECVNGAPQILVSPGD
ncbi:hypothetical protein [Actinoplanes sp. OR16]|uniref:hypothetical protein n=1 Tax=Actinoplanes sp. OR16 TaxID=946334 RepID=UPI000FD87D1E|nr:hypothetical protein [Actinoplanes sp. OR16]